MRCTTNQSSNTESYSHSLECYRLLLVNVGSFAMLEVEVKVPAKVAEDVIKRIKAAIR